MFQGYSSKTVASRAETKFRIQNTQNRRFRTFLKLKIFFFLNFIFIEKVKDTIF